MNRIDRAKRFRKQIEANLKATRSLIRVDELSQEELTELNDLYPQHSIGKAYVVGDIFNYNNNLYKVIQAHKSQEDWKPDSAASLYLKIQAEGVIPEFKQPTGAHDAYKRGDKVIFESKVYESLIDNNTYSPTAYPEGWKIIK